MGESRPISLIVLAALVAASTWTLAVACTSTEGLSSDAFDAGAFDGATHDDGSAGRFCDRIPRTIFCDDFDGDPLSVVWDGPPSVGNGGSAERDVSTFRSPPLSLVVKVPTLGNENGHAKVTKTFGKGKTSVHLRFALRVTSPGDRYSELAWIGYDYGTYRLTFRAPSNARAALFEYFPTLPDGGNVPSNLHFIDASVPHDEWVTVKIDADFGSATPTASFEFDTGTGTQRSGPFPIEPTRLDRDLQITIGLPNDTGPSSPAELRYDDVTCEYK